MATLNNCLSSLQSDLVAVLGNHPGCYVTGGTVLGSHLGHRRSLDVDIFVLDGADVEILGALLERVGAEKGWQVHLTRSFPGFKRYLVRQLEEQTLVDIVHESVPQIVRLDKKPLADGVRFDSLEDIVANKLCAVLGRSETKDLVDLYFLAVSGVDVLAHLGDAHSKDGGMDPSTLAYVLNQMPTDPSGLLLLRLVDEETLVAFRDQLVTRLLALAWPNR